MGQRVIPVAVTAEYIGGDGVTLGAAGSHNSVLIEYDFRAAGPMWDDVTVRYVLWTNPQGNTTNRVNLGVDKLVPGYDNKVYHASPTADAMCVSGWAEMVVVGAIISDGNEVIKVKTEPSRFRVLPGSSSAADNEGIAATVADQLQSEIETVDSRKVSKPLTPLDPDGESGQLLMSLGGGMTEWVDFSPEAVEKVLDEHPEWITRIGTGTVTSDKLADGAVITQTIKNASVTEVKLGTDVRDRLNGFEPEEDLNATSTRPPQTKAVYEAIVAEAATRKMQDDALAAADANIRSQIAAPFNYKGACTYANLPASPSLNDAWYVTDREYLMAWNGSAWGKAGPGPLGYDSSLTALEDRLAVRTEEQSNETDRFLNLVTARLDGLASFTGGNRRIIDLDENIITFDHDPSNTNPTGSTYAYFLISSGPKYLGSIGTPDEAWFTENLTAQDFTAFNVWPGVSRMTVEIEVSESIVSPRTDTNGFSSVIYLVTRDPVTGGVSFVQPYDFTYRDNCSRSYRYYLDELLPAAIANQTLAVVFVSRKPAQKGSVKLTFRNEYIDLAHRVEALDQNATKLFLDQQKANLDSLANFTPGEQGGRGVTNKRKIHLYKDTVAYDHDPNNPGPTGSWYVHYLISKEPRLLDTGNFDNYLTADDFTPFAVDAGKYNLIMTLDLNNEVDDARVQAQGTAYIPCQSYITIATMGSPEPYESDQAQGGETPETEIVYYTGPRESFSGSCWRSYEINLSKELPAIMRNKNLAVIFTSTFPGVRGAIRIGFRFEATRESTAYWEEELEASIETVRENIMEAPLGSPTMLFITDCHWDKNYKKSPHLVKRVMDACNINAFVNGGDMIQGTHIAEADTPEAKAAAKAAAVTELTECLSAFPAAGCRLPMISLYGNHDRNRDAAVDRFDWDVCLTKEEHLMLSLDREAERFYGIKYLDNNHYKTASGTEVEGKDPVDVCYWEDETYRYATIYYHGSSSRHLDWLPALFDTEKQVVIFTHGVYFSLDYDSKEAEDANPKNANNMWLFNAMAGYKSKIRCIIQGHTHNDAFRWIMDGQVPVIIIDCDTFRSWNSTNGTISEQSFAVVTIEPEEIKVVKVGRGQDWPVIDSETGEFTYNYSRQMFVYRE